MNITCILLMHGITGYLDNSLKFNLIFQNMSFLCNKLKQGKIPGDSKRFKDKIKIP